jgi:TetR/AcrR family transcriptional regulator, regulator of autoinduction and epiphytic fitness
MSTAGNDTPPTGPRSTSPRSTTADDGRVVRSEDGRHLRRDRNRTAVVNALLSLYSEGSLDPSSVEIAERAGLSPRSLFRYFDDVDDLCHEAVMARQRTLLPLLVIDATPSDTIQMRVAALLRQRKAVFAAMGNVGRVARLREPFLPVIAAELGIARAFLRGQIEKLFAAELAAMSPVAASAALMSIDVLCSFEARQLFSSDQQLSAETVDQNLTILLLGLFVTEDSTTRSAS